MPQMRPVAWLGNETAQVVSFLLPVPHPSLWGGVGEGGVGEGGRRGV